MTELAVDLGNTPFNKTLLLAGRVVFGVFLEVSMSARLGNGFDDLGPGNFFQLLQFGAQLFGAACGDGYLICHDVNS